MNENDKFWKLQHENYLAFPYDPKHRYEAWQPGRWAANRSAASSLVKYFNGIKSAMELGAGSAAFSMELSRQYGCRITCIDMSTEAEKYARRIASDMGIKLDYKIANVFDETQKADVVLSLGVIEHYSRKMQIEFIEQCSKLSNKYVLIAIPNQESMIFQNYCSWARSKNGEYEEEHKALNVTELKELMEQSGLEVVHVDGFQVFLSEKEFWNDTDISSIPLYTELKKMIADSGVDWPDFPITNFTYEDIANMVEIEKRLGEQIRTEYGFMTYVLAQKKV